jgi:hypothetical protein
LQTFGRTGVVQIILAPHDRDASVIRVYVELSADLGRFESIMLTLGDGAALVQVRAVDDGGTWFQLAAPTRAGWFGEPPRAPGHWADLVFDEEFDFDNLHVAAVDISTEALESVGDRARVFYERAGGPGEALIVICLMASSSTALEVSVVAEATVCAIGLRWQANVEAVAFDQRFAGATAADNLPGSALGLFATENCLAAGKSQPIATLHFADGFHVESFDFLEMTVVDDTGAALAAVSLAQLTTEAVSDAPTLLPTASHPPTRVPTMAPTKFEHFCGPDPGDVDGINGADVTDALLVAKYTQGQGLRTSACDMRIAFGCADVNADDATDVLDALLIARAYVGLVDLDWPGPPSAAPTTIMPTTGAPTFATEPPTERPTYSPSARPTSPPSTSLPSYEPSAQPTMLWDPSPAPTAPSYAPTAAETYIPPLGPSAAPSYPPSAQLSYEPTTSAPTEPPSRWPYSPTRHPSAAPTYATPLPGTISPTTQHPSATPTYATNPPSFSLQPSHRPTAAPLPAPTMPRPSYVPTSAPTRVSAPSYWPTKSLIPEPTVRPTPQPSYKPTIGAVVTSSPTTLPVPMFLPFPAPTAEPTTTVPMTAAPAIVPTMSGYVMDDTSIRAAVAAWLSNPAAAEATYGHISRWDTRGVTDMSFLFSIYTNAHRTLTTTLVRGTPLAPRLCTRCSATPRPSIKHSAAGASATSGT